MREVEELDEAIAKTEAKLGGALIIRRLLVAGLIIEPIALTVLLYFDIPLVRTESQSADGASTLLLFGAVALLTAIIATAGTLFEHRDQVSSLQHSLRRLQEKRKHILAGGENTRLTLLRRYKNDLPDVVESFRIKARGYRRTSSALQIVVIVGSLATSSTLAAWGNSEFGRTAGIVGTLLIGTAAAFNGYFKFKEKSLNLQRTADDIECENRAVDLRIGDYQGKPDEVALTEFAARVEVLRVNQSRQQIELDQPAEIQYRTLDLRE